MRAFVTGGHGFVGPWLRAHLLECGDEVFDPAGLDVTDPASVRDHLTASNPEVVFHLAAKSNPSDPQGPPGFAVNYTGVQAVTRAGATLDQPPRIVMISTAQVYAPGAEPVCEEAFTKPVGDYARSKSFGEDIALEAADDGHDVIVIRPFNHTGPGQSADFVVPALTRRCLAACRDNSATVVTGDLEVVRDFCDVRDVVMAYRMLAMAGSPGEIYNVCSGSGVTIAAVAAKISDAVGRPDLEFVSDSALQRRGADGDVRVGDPTKLKSLTGWTPEITLDKTIADVVTWWRERF